MSGPKSSRYTLTPEQRRILAEQRAIERRKSVASENIRRNNKRLLQIGSMFSSAKDVSGELMSRCGNDGGFASKLLELENVIAPIAPIISKTNNDDVNSLESTSKEVAASLVKDGDVIFLDSSSSAYNIIPYLALKNNITVITCGIKALAKLGEYNIKAICTGGTLIPSCQTLVGDDAYTIIEQNNADIFFFSCRGLSSEGLLTDISEQENYVRRKMMKNSAKSYLLCASEKFNKKYFHNLCSVKDITGIISEKEIPDNF